jgi:hypothetical protein
LEDPGIYGRIILNWMSEKWGGGAWSGSILFQDRDRWLALVNAVMKLRVCKTRGISGVAENLFAKEGLCSMELV